MRKDFGAKAALYPMPVFIIASYDEDGKADAMNAAWGGVTGNDEITMCLSKSHKTVKNILKRKAFTVSMGDAAHVTACDYVGLVSGNDVEDKLQKAGFTTTKSEKVDAPVINELAVCVECEMKSYDEVTQHMTGRIVNVSVDESAMTDGKVDVTKVRPVIYDSFNHVYYEPGQIVGNAFSDGEKLK